MYWGRAAHRPLNIRPDIDGDDIEDERIGPKFLWEFEQAKKAQIVQNGSVVENATHQISSADSGQTITQNGPAIENAADKDGKAITQNGTAIESEQLRSVTEPPTATADEGRTEG